MKISKLIGYIFFTLLINAVIGLRAEADTHTAANCTVSAVQTAVNAAVDGDTVLIPDGSCSWSTGISTTKQIKIRAQNYTPTLGGNTSRSVTITNNSSSPLFSLTSGDSYHVGIAGIRFNEGTGDVNHIRFNGTGSKIPLINDCYFQVKDRSGNQPDIGILALLSQGGVMWNCYVAANVSNGVGNASIYISSPRAWYTASTLGNLDTNGTVNWYFEDNTFFNVGQCPDIDNNGRVVIRYSSLDGSGGLTHGFTSSWGGRHFEYYNNTFSVTTEERNHVGRYFWARAGHGIFTDNVVNDSSYPGAYGHVTLLSTIVEGGGSYPKPRQVGWGHNGSTNVIDPIYIWNNTGARGSTWGTDSPTYIQLNREIYVNSGAKPGYSKYTYPHPLRNQGSSDTTPPSPPTGLGIQ